MKLLQRLPDRKWPNGKNKPMGRFKCPRCHTQLIRPLYRGQAQKGCGCFNHSGRGNPNYRHGFNRTPLYRVWAAMMRRCRVKKDAHYHLYGGRGISVCVEWRKAKGFLDWAILSGYRRGLCIDRIDNDKGYSPENCRWVSRQESGQHKRNVKLSLILARAIREAYSVGWKRSELAKKFGVCWQTIDEIVKGTVWSDAN